MVLIFLLAVPFLGLTVAAIAWSVSINESLPLLAIFPLLASIVLPIWGATSFFLPAMNRLSDAVFSPDWGKHPTRYRDIQRIIYPRFFAAQQNVER